MIIEDLLQTVLHEKRLQDLVTEDGKLWNAIIEFAKRYHEQQVKSVGLADVVGRSEQLADKGRYCNACGDYVGKGCDNLDCEDFKG